VILVADASPLHYLVLIEQVELVGALFGLVLVPDTVAQGLRHSRAPASVAEWMTHPPTWLQIEPAHGPTDAALDDLDRANGTQSEWR
jgi:predicted nucleic acid-binding protein